MSLLFARRQCRRRVRSQDIHDLLEGSRVTESENPTIFAAVPFLDRTGVLMQLIGLTLQELEGFSIQEEMIVDVPNQCYVDTIGIVDKKG